jgi:hypothetical protein
MSIKTGNLRAIAYHLEQGHDNGDITREALALFLRGVADEIEHHERLAAAIGEVIHYVENTKCAVDESDSLAWYNYRGNLEEIDYVEIPTEYIIKLIAAGKQQAFDNGRSVQASIDESERGE